MSKTDIKQPNLRQILRFRVQEQGEKIAYIENPSTQGGNVETSYAELYNKINAVGTALQNPLFAEDLTKINPMNIPGMDRRRIAVLGNNSVEWVIAQNVAVFGAGLAVPLDKQLSVPEMKRLLERARVRTIFIDASKNKLLQALIEDGGEIKNIILIGYEKDRFSINARENDLWEAERGNEAGGILVAEPRIWNINDLITYGDKKIKAGVTDFLDCQIDNEAPAAIFFTSGTTSESKGVVLSNKNICHIAYICKKCINLPHKGAALSVLPMHHTLENSTQYVCWDHGAAVVINNGLRYISSNLQNKEVSLVVTVPLLLENIKNKVEQGIRKKGMEKKFNSLRKFSRFLLKFGIDIRAELFKKIRAAIGPHLQMFIVGAAPLAKETEEFFFDIGLPTYVGYGLTETAPILTNNSAKFHRSGSVGKTGTDVEMRIDCVAPQKEGEIMVRCPNLMLGYYEDQTATSAVIDNDGWFHTGDVGYLDKDGFLFITGRVKSMIVLKNGKKVFPEEIESIFDLNQIIKQVMIFGGDNKRGSIDICAVFQVDASLLTEENYLQKISDEISGQIQRVNSKLAEYKSIKYWVWTTDELVMTSTLKIKREPTLNKILDYLDHKNDLWREISGQNISLK